jgi:hypothetical protein
MSKSVKKHCSILNYIRHSDNELYELVQDLCIGRMFVPRRGSPGLTFLHPSKELLAKIKDMATGDNPEEAVAALQSLVLLDYLPTIGDFDNKKTDIPTFLRNKLPVSGSDGKKVNLKNGAEIVLDKNFEARNDRSNIIVYKISKALVPTDTEKSDFSNVTKKSNRKIKGGAAFLDGRKKLFEVVVLKCCDDSGDDPAMEVLVSLCDFLEHNDYKPELELVRSQLSYDTLASLAIVLQPFKSTGSPYLSNDILKKWTDVYTDGSTSVYCYNPNPGSDYEKHRSKCQSCKISDGIEQINSDLTNVMSKLTVIPELPKAYEKLSDIFVNNINPKRLETLLSKTLALAESELRVYSALLHDNSEEKLSVVELTKLFSHMCNLTVPYMVNDKESMANCNLGFYYSSAFLIARSNALCYVPSKFSDHDLSKIASSDKIDLDNGFKNKYNKTLEYYIGKKDNREKNVIEKATMINNLVKTHNLVKNHNLQ